jgi:hypothetical protein
VEDEDEAGDDEVDGGDAEAGMSVDGGDEEDTEGTSKKKIFTGLDFKDRQKKKYVLICLN